MIVSFDLDETLFVNPEKVPTENKLGFPFDKIYKDRLRAGTVELLTWINSSDIKLWIYTTSFRSEKYIHSIFKHYNVKIDNVINGERHEKEVQRNKSEKMPSKYPSKYHIDLHIDDEFSVYQNGISFGFRVYLLKENDVDWVNSVKSEILRIKKILDINKNKF